MLTKPVWNEEWFAVELSSALGQFCWMLLLLHLHIHRITESSRLEGHPVLPVQSKWHTALPRSIFLVYFCTVEVAASLAYHLSSVTSLQLYSELCLKSRCNTTPVCPRQGSYIGSFFVACPYIQF